MEIKTKFNLGEVVYPIRNYRREVTTVCSTCDGIGEVTLAGKGYRCPECSGSGSMTYFEPVGWRPIEEFASAIGKVSVEMYANQYHENNEDRIRYMLKATGVGSGNMWSEDDLFASMAEAQEECDRRNK